MCGRCTGDIEKQYKAARKLALNDAAGNQSIDANGYQSSSSKRKVTKTPTTPSGKSPAPKKTCVYKTPVPIAFSTPAAHPLKDGSSKCRSQLFSDKVNSIESAMKQSKYDTAFRHVLSYNPKTSKKHFNTVVQNVVADEVKAYVKHCETFPTFDGVDSLERFKMDDIIAECQKFMPTYYAALCGAFDTQNRRRRHIDPEKEAMRQELIKPRLAFMATIPLYTRNPRKFKFLQAALGVQLHKGGATEKVRSIQGSQHQGKSWNCKGNVSEFR